MRASSPGGSAEIARATAQSALAADPLEEPAWKPSTPRRWRPSRKEPNVITLARAIAWPVISLLVIGGTHLLLEALRPELHDVIGPAVVMPIYLVVGGWTAFGVARVGGGYIGGLAAAAIVGLMPAALQLIGFGLLLGRDGSAVTTSALFGLAAMTWGGALGAGIAVSLGIPDAVRQADRAEGRDRTSSRAAGEPGGI
jgi:hypothetical protein